MSESVINISNKQLLLTYIFVIIAMVLTSLNGLNRNKDIIIATLRMTAQLFIAGSVLIYIFDSSSFVFAALMILIMEFFAVFNIVSSKKNELSKGMIIVIAI